MLAAGAASATAQADLVAIGTLECTAGPSIGLAAGGRQHARCEFRAEKTAARTDYLGRLEKIRGTLLPSGGRLSWTVLSKSDGSTRRLEGRYLASERREGTSQRKPYTLCSDATPDSICLQPVVGDGRRKRNHAPAISVFRLEVTNSGR
jgi:hypothetical protein